MGEPFMATGFGELKVFSGSAHPDLTREIAAFLGAIFDFDGPGPFFPMLLVYYIVFWTWKQTSFGGLVCQLRLVRADGMPLSFADSLVRGLAGIFSLLVVGIGALWIIRDPEGQAWHDKIAGTYVVKVPRTWSL